ncbi:MAG TPA: hypothetical protein VK369_06085 [Segetibacter sp.]|nr:hypothetical protein [Segetibacter sp.]
MNKFNFIAWCCIITLLACSSSPSKKVLIMGRGAITTNGNEITMKEGSGYSEETVEVSGEKAISWNVTTPAGKTTINIPEEKGFYVLNLKTDTIVGSQQILGKDLSSGRTMTQEELKIKIDSLTKLTTGSNVSPGGPNYIILPNQVVKISSNTEAKIFGPFTKIPGTLEAGKDGKTPELYKFYTNSEMRGLIASLKKMTF